MKRLAESTVEQAALAKLESIGRRVALGSEIAPDTIDAERGERLSGKHRANIIRLLQERLEPFMLHLRFSHTFGVEELRNITRKPRRPGKNAENGGD